MNRIFMAAGVAVVNSHTDQGHHTLKSGVKSIQPGFKRLFSSGGGAESAAEVRVMASAASRSDFDGAGDDRRRRQIASTDESVRQAMFLNCWGPS